MELVVCSACKRHVAVAERACPFCATTLAPQRPQYVRATSFTRAAIFSAAALASGCESKKSTPAPAPVPVQTGSAGSADDLEKLLDKEQPVADMPASTDAGVAAVNDASIADAGIAPPDPAQVAKDKREAHEKRQKRLLEKRKREEQLKQVEDLQIRQREMAKPYGAPPARRRVV